MKPQTSNAVRESIVNWLRVPENFLLITGAAGFSSPVVSGTKLKKKDAHESLAKFVNQKHKTAFSATEMKRKHDWLFSQYKKAKDLSKTDVNPEQIQKKCPFYKEIDALFKDRQIYKSTIYYSYTTFEMMFGLKKQLEYILLKYLQFFPSPLLRTPILYRSY